MPAHYTSIQVYRARFTNLGGMPDVSTTSIIHLVHYMPFIGPEAVLVQ